MAKSSLSKSETQLVFFNPMMLRTRLTMHAAALIVNNHSSVGIDSVHDPVTWYKITHAGTHFVQ